MWTLYGYGWVTLGLFLISITGHWIFGWYAYADEQLAHNQPVEFSAYFVEVMRDTLENWQSEFLQLIWQVGGLSLLLYAGSPQSRDSEDRVEEKLDAILAAVKPGDGEKLIAEIDSRHYRR